MLTEEIGRDAARAAALPDSQRDAALLDCLGASTLRTVFQPILDLRLGRVYGYEALTRGPAGSAYESPAALFRLAEAHGRSAEVEFLAVRCAIERFAALKFDGLLFVNFTPAVIAARSEDPEALLGMLRRQGMAPKQLVIELTENGTIRDSSPAWAELLRCRALGFGIAIDDLGEGFASLRLWSELRPEYVKVDKHSVAGIHRDPIKLQMVRAIQQIAQVSGAAVIAEGIEQQNDFQTVRDLGIRHGQGFLIGRPAGAPLAPTAPES
jgi:EAL domain-containing protein (putative c-di-GMP-specific phosphodiesterase class I)